MKTTFTTEDVCDLTGLSPRQVTYWVNKRLISAAEGENGRLLFDFRAVVAFKTIRRLLDEGLPTRRIRRLVERLKSLIPEINQPLTELRIAILGKEMVVNRDRTTFTPEGQIIIDFDKAAAPSVPVQIDRIQDRFFEAIELDEADDLPGASRCYESVLRSAPAHADALVNLGNLKHRLGRSDEAEAMYRKALCINPDHAEANYDLANILEEKDDLQNAILFYSKAVHEDADFASAHFNLARLLERRGDNEAAKKHWRIFLELESVGEWADYARQRLEDSEGP